MPKAAQKPKKPPTDDPALLTQLEEILESPKEVGVVELIISRPTEGERKVMKRAALSAEDGVKGDRWQATSWKKLPDGSPDPAVQVTLMNARCIRAIAGEKENWAIAGDNLFVDLDLSRENLPTGTKLQIGKCVLEVTRVPHLGCSKFKRRFGEAALYFVNAPQRKPLRLRGIHAKVIQPGHISVGDSIRVVRTV